MPNSPKDLKFHNILYSRDETIWDLSCLLYIGGSAINSRARDESLHRLDGPLTERLPLVEKIYDFLDEAIASGGSRHTAHSKIRSVRAFYTWADNNGASPTLTSVPELFAGWTEYLIQRHRKNELKEVTIYHLANSVATILDPILELEDGILRSTRLRKPQRAPGYTQSGKQDLDSTFKMGAILLNIRETLTTEVIFGKLPVVVNLTNGRMLNEWSGLQPIDDLKTLSNPKANAWAVQNIFRKRTAYENDRTHRTRHPLLNLRIECELLIFIAQTGMNLAQAHQLKIGNFSYQSYLRGYKVFRVYKGRRKGEVEFEIFSEYRQVFDQYLRWRRENFDENEVLLFPFIKTRNRSIDIPPIFAALKKRFSELNETFVGPRMLRQTRTNWLLRRTKNIDFVAQANQHSPLTLIRNYDKPNHQVALREIADFHVVSNATNEPPGPGNCGSRTQTPSPSLHISLEAPAPDCSNPSGCLFCLHYQDIDTRDHAWSLLSYRHLKVLELIGQTTTPDFTQQPVTSIVARIDEKVAWFESSSPVRNEWVHEAKLRVLEEDYHPKWDGFIQLMDDII